MGDLYGVTKNGFLLKRMDTILDELHGDLSEGWGFDTQADPQSVISVLVTGFASRISDLWETAQESYYAKYPATAEGVNLDHANQYGGIRRAGNKPTVFSLHCTGDDGTIIRKDAIVSTATKPAIKLLASAECKITRESFNKAIVKVVAEEDNSYSLSINGEQYSYVNSGGSTMDILTGLKDKITDDGYMILADPEAELLILEDKRIGGRNALVLSDNLTTESVTTIGAFRTEGYGKFVLPYGAVNTIITNIKGFDTVINRLEPTYGRLQETDIEFRQSYLAKSGIRSTGMLGSIKSELLNNVANVENVEGYENCGETTDAAGRPPHSIEIVVSGGSDMEIAEVILKKKGAGIQTYGSVVVHVAGDHGDMIPIRFNRPQTIYAWMRVTLYGDLSLLPPNYKSLTIEAILEQTNSLKAGDHLLSQLLNSGIFSRVGGLTYVDISIAPTPDQGHIPEVSEYTYVNLFAEARQQITVEDRILDVEFAGAHGG